MPFSWDNRALRYRAPSGQFVKREAITQAVESAIAETADRLQRIGLQLQRGEINLSQFVLSARDLIKANHLLAGGIARGGKMQLSPAILGSIGAQTREQYKFLNNFARQLERGLPMDKRFLNRIKMYASAARQTFSESERRMKRDAGYNEERNVLNAAESCVDCQSEASKGWVKVGSISPVGSRICRVNCRCQILSRKAA